ncbi:hypothetical protein ACOSP7_031362 [Xanthoceras sorbifolium]
MEDPPKNRVDDDRVEDQVEAYVEAPVEDRVDDDGVLEDRTYDLAEDRVKDAADNRVKARKRVLWIVAWVGSVVKIIFRSSMSMLAGSFILFLSGISFYHNKEFVGTGSLFNFFPVLKASLLKRHLSYPYSPNRFFFSKLWKPNTLIASTQNLQMTGQAAIIESSHLCPEQQEQAGRLCTMTQVEESNFLLKMIPMWSTFLVISLAASTGDTFSSEQGEHLDSTDFTFYIVIFFLTSKKGVSNSKLQLGKIVRIWFGMVLCTIFYVVAWRVEYEHLLVGTEYCLLGLMQGSGITGLDEFMIGELPKSLKNYASTMIGFVVDGIGNFLGILFVYANKQLFSATMNESHLDKYNFQLMILSFLNMC